MRFYGWMHKILMRNNVTLYCPLWCETLLCSLSLLLLPQQVRTKLIFSALISHTYLESNFLLLAPMTTYLKDLIQSIGRYGGLSWQNWFKGCLEAQVVSLLGARNLASMRGNGKLDMFEWSMTIYFNWDVRKHNPLRRLPCPTSTLLACHT